MARYDPPLWAAIILNIVFWGMVALGIGAVIAAVI